MQYSSTLDQLRGIAIILVVLFHCDIYLFSNGYIGVDIFFVLSGFLISGNLLEYGQKHGYISISQFYARRIKRLFGESFILLSIVSVAYIYIYSLEFIIEHRGWFISPVLYIANWFYISDATDYWRRESDVNSPTLHYWSLSVEEQFYFIFPLIMYILIKLPYFTHILFALFLIVLSLAYIMLIETRDSVVHMSTIARIYQFGLGMIAMILSRQLFQRGVWKQRICICVKNRTFRCIIQTCLLSMILISSLHIVSDIISKQKVISLFVSIMTSLFLLSININYNPKPTILNEENESTKEYKIGTLLKLIGVYSYGIYLWHWPIIVFISLYYNNVGKIIYTSIVFVSSFAIAFVSKKTNDWLFSRADTTNPKHIRIIIGIGIVVPLIFVACIHGYIITGKVERMIEQTTQSQEMLFDMETRYKELNTQIDKMKTMLSETNYTLSHQFIELSNYTQNINITNITIVNNTNISIVPVTPDVPLKTCSKETIYGSCYDGVKHTPNPTGYPFFYETLTYEKAQSENRLKVSAIGDSFALRFALTGTAISKEYDINFHFFSSVSCPMLYGNWQYDQYHGISLKYILECTGKHQKLIFEQEAEYKPNVVIMFIFSWYGQFSMKSPSGQKVVMGDLSYDEAYYQYRRAFFEKIANYTDTLVVIAPTPIFEAKTGFHCLNTKKGCGDCDHAFKQLDKMNDVNKEIATNKRALKGLGYYLDINDILCPCGTCPARFNNFNVMNDEVHVSQEYHHAKRYEFIRKLKTVGIHLDNNKIDMEMYKKLIE